MAITAHAVPNLEITAPDDMDLHSDSGLDFDDGDIELDLAPAPPVQHQDDDVSIKDAATDAGLDTETVPVDQDDFMVDNEDFVGDDTVFYGDEAITDKTLLNTTAALQDQVPTPPEEDLIDYSDDDDEEPPNYQHASLNQPASEFQAADNEDLDLQTKHDQANVQESGSADGDFGTHDDQTQEQDNDAHNANEEEQDYVRKTEVEGAGNHTDDDDGGVLLKDLEHQTNNNEYQNDGDQDQQSSGTRTITVNYEGNELWLFKQHDTEDSGDWLLEDMSVVNSSLSDLFQACRTSLGEDISHETELGLRFDHLHNMELYEDNTACVAVSLERLVDLYHTLHAQDGTDEPESFYMCLLSRPRFATLLSDVAKHAEQGSGYSGLNSAVAAGETHFADVYSGHSTEHEAVEWDNEEEREGQHEGTESASEAEPEHTEHGEQDDESGDNEEEQLQERASPERGNGSTSEDATYVEQVSPRDNNSTTYEKIDPSKTLAQHDDAQGQTARQGSESSSKVEQEQRENDTVDYSDAEDSEDGEGPQTGSINALSPSSSTVQGDDPATTAEDPTELTGSTKREEEHASNQDGAAHSVEDADDTHPHIEEQLSHEDNTDSYQDYTQTYDQGDDPFEGFQMGATDSYPEDTNFEGYTNQDYTGYEYQDLDQQLQDDFISGADLDGTGANGSTNAVNDFTGRDDFLDLDNAAEWVIDQEPMSKVPGDAVLVHDEVTAQSKEEEDGVAEQPAVAASSTADPVAASSTDLQETSPQGQKRSIDEVGDSVGDALDLIDLKRPRV